MDRIVLDTNCLIMSLSIRSPYYEIWKGFKEKKYTLCLTNEIVEEYEEKLCEKINDRHFRILQQIEFPKVDVIDIDAFLKILTES